MRSDIVLAVPDKGVIRISNKINALIDVYICDLL